jgi:membrane associated rhomboid family serine protease
MSRVSATPPPRAYWAALAARGAWLLAPAVLFGGITLALVRGQPSLMLAAALGGLAGLFAGIWLPSRRRRRAQNAQLWAQLTPAVRTQWQHAFEGRDRARTLIVLLPPLVYIVALVWLSSGTWPPAPAPIADAAVAALFSALAVSAATWGLQWLGVAWTALRQAPLVR